METIVINLFGEPSAGKSTCAMDITAQLKRNGINAEYVSEFAKDKVYENNGEVFKHQEYLFGKNKSHIDMSGSLFIDDSAHNLETSNAEIKICFGEIYPWNKNWDGKHYWNWNMIYQIYKAELED